MSPKRPGVPFQEAMENLAEAVSYLFGTDFSVRSVGIVRVDGGFGYRAVRNSKTIFAAAGRPADRRDFKNVPVTYADVSTEIEALVRIPGPGAATARATGTIPERLRHRHLLCGIQVQNFDDDARQGVAPNGMVVGTLGCFVTKSNGERALLSNNHVVAAENRGLKRQDQIFQPGDVSPSSRDRIAVLTDFEPLLFSAPGATIANQSAALNTIDAGIATVDAHVQSLQSFHPTRQVPGPAGTGQPQIGERVFKVGRTTGLTHGEVVEVEASVGPIKYPSGLCWFERSFVIEGVDGRKFSADGDSGSAILNQSGEVLGLLYAGNTLQTYACPIEPALKFLGCVIAAP